MVFLGLVIGFMLGFGVAAKVITEVYKEEIQFYQDIAADCYKIIDEYKTLGNKMVEKLNVIVDDGGPNGYE